MIISQNIIFFKQDPCLNYTIVYINSGLVFHIIWGFICCYCSDVLPLLNYGNEVYWFWYDIDYLYPVKDYKILISWNCNYKVQLCGISCYHCYFFFKLIIFFSIYCYYCYYFFPCITVLLFVTCNTMLWSMACLYSVVRVSV